MGDLKTTIERMKECQRIKEPEKIINCLIELFSQTNDGWVAFNIGLEYEKINRLEEALDFYQKAEELMPLPDYRENARQAISRIKTRLIEAGKAEYVERATVSLAEILMFAPTETLLIIPCTSEKVWQVDPTAPDFVPARYAYRGKKFRDFVIWAEENQLEKKGFFWLILSGKYGFLEPWAPISRYNISLSDQRDFSISAETLKNQVKQKRWWRTGPESLAEKRIADYQSVILINCRDSHKDRIKEAFPEAHYHEATS
ncbi:MAG TPA: tetratricopeptide repeat protein [Candidatus Saccharicenans sp.]|nr:tetratricopeptide repeat protein [Candidatus Saccharicenans sp.]